MDLDLELEAPTQVPSRVSRFAPGSSKLNPKPKPKSEPKPEPQPPVSKPEPQEFDLTVKKNEDGADGTIKMDVDPKSETEDESKQGSEPMDEDTAEDTVVREIDVFFNPSIDADTQLYVLQYPLRPCWRPYELDDQCEEVRLKPGSSEVEVDLSIDMESSNIDKQFASELNFTKQTLSTSWKPPHGNGYAVGLLMGDKLHLHPVHAVVQLRPLLQHLKSGGSKKRNIMSTGANDTVKTESSIEEKSAATSKKQTESSIEQKIDGEECWVPLKYHSCKSDISSRYLQQMVAQESSPINFTMSPYDYVTTLCPGVSSNGPSRRSLLLLPLEQRLKKLLIEGPPLHRFSAIKHFAPEYSDEKLLESLQNDAILVWGLWAPKSEVLYPDGGLECLARDMALVLFWKNLTVYASDVNVGSNLGKHVIKYLQKFGSERSDPRNSDAQWKFKELPDESFKKLYPEIVEKQKKVLEGIEKQVSDACSIGKRKVSKNSVANRRESGEHVKSANSDQRVTSLGRVPPEKMTMSNETQHALPIALKKLFQNHKVCSFQMICQGLREMADSKSPLPKADYKIVVDAARSLDGPHEELKAVISEVAYNIHGYYVLKSSQDDQLRDVVIDLLRGSGPNAKLKKAEILEAARRKLSREVTNNEYNKGQVCWACSFGYKPEVALGPADLDVMNELCVSKGSVWVLKSSDGSMP